MHRQNIDDKNICNDIFQTNFTWRDNLCGAHSIICTAWYMWWSFVLHGTCGGHLYCMVHVLVVQLEAKG